VDGRRRKKPRKNQLCLRLNDVQLNLLQRYAGFKDMSSEVDALRAIIDGLAPWLDRREAEVQENQAHSGLLPAPGASVAPPSIPTSVTTSIASQPVQPPAAEEETSRERDDGEALGDFGGRPRLKLPGMPMDGELP
jgi:hypothetical protein